MLKAWVYIRCMGIGGAATLALLSAMSLAQTNPEGKAPQTEAGKNSQQGPVVIFRAHADLVLIPVTVTDKLNRFVLGLQKEDFQLFEDGAEQNVAIFSDEDAPLSVGVVFDTSGSMTDKLAASRQGAAQLLNTLSKEDEAFLVEFSDIAKLSVGFTGQTEKIRSALNNARPGGLTAMLDAIDTGLLEMKKAQNSRKAIVIVSDGGDNRSHYTPAQIESLVREADVQICYGGFRAGFLFGDDSRGNLRAAFVIRNCGANRWAGFCGCAPGRHAERSNSHCGRIAQSVRPWLLPQE